MKARKGFFSRIRQWVRPRRSLPEPSPGIKVGGRSVHPFRAPKPLAGMVLMRRWQRWSPAQVLLIRRHWPLRLDYRHLVSETLAKRAPHIQASGISLFRYLGRRYLRRTDEAPLLEPVTHLPMAPAFWPVSDLQWGYPTASQIPSEAEQDREPFTPGASSLIPQPLAGEQLETAIPPADTPSQGLVLGRLLQRLGLRKSSPRAPDAALEGNRGSEKEMGMPAIEPGVVGERRDIGETDGSALPPSPGPLLEMEKPEEGSDELIGSPGPDAGRELDHKEMPTAKADEADSAVPSESAPPDSYQTGGIKQKTPLASRIFARLRPTHRKIVQREEVRQEQPTRPSQLAAAQTPLVTEQAAAAAPVDRELLSFQARPERFRFTRRLLARLSGKRKLRLKDVSRVPRSAQAPVSESFPEEKIIPQPSIGKEPLGLSLRQQQPRLEVSPEHLLAEPEEMTTGEAGMPAKPRPDIDKAGRDEGAEQAKPSQPEQQSLAIRMLSRLRLRVRRPDEGMARYETKPASKVAGPKLPRTVRTLQKKLPLRPVLQNLPLATKIMARLRPKEKPVQGDLVREQRTAPGPEPAERLMMEKTASPPAPHRLEEKAPWEPEWPFAEALPEQRGVEPRRVSEDKDEDAVQIQPESSQGKAVPPGEWPSRPLPERFTLVRRILTRLHPARKVAAKISPKRKAGRAVPEGEQKTLQGGAVEKGSRPEPSGLSEAEGRPVADVAPEPVFRAARAALMALAQGPGVPLDLAVRQRFESFFGQDLGDVRIHTGSAAEGVTKEVTAEAVTMGDHIFFASQVPEPQTPHRLGLLAHELTHVVQGRAFAARSAMPLRSSQLESYLGLRPEERSVQPPLAVKTSLAAHKEAGMPPLMAAPADRSTAPAAAAPVATARITGVEGASPEGEAAGPNLDQMAVSVYEIIKRKLRVEVERLPQ